jgi:UDP-galactopyranose mutase
VFDYLVIGAGFAGSVLAERLAATLGKKVLIVDKRSHIGGNAYDCYNDDGVLIHKYGPHIDPYYPIPRPENAALYRQYQELGEATVGVHFAGRLGTYKYYNMDQVVAQALTTFAKIAGVRRSDGVTA